MFYHTNKDKLNNLQRIVQLHLMHFVVQTAFYSQFTLKFLVRSNASYERDKLMKILYSKSRTCSLLAAPIPCKQGLIVLVI